MKLLITIYQDEDGVFIAECPSIPGCVSQGNTEEEADRNVREAIKECLEVRAEKGMPLTVTTPEVEVLTLMPPVPILRPREVVAAFQLTVAGNYRRGRAERRPVAAW